MALRRTKIGVEVVQRVSDELVAAETALAQAAAEHERILRETAADLAVAAISPGDAAALTGPAEETLRRTTTAAERLRLQEAEEARQAEEAHARPWRPPARRRTRPPRCSRRSWPRRREPLWRWSRSATLPPP